MTINKYGTIRVGGVTTESQVQIHDNGYVFVEDFGRYFPPHQVQFFEPSDDQPELD